MSDHYILQRTQIEREKVKLPTVKILLTANYFCNEEFFWQKTEKKFY